MNQSNRANQSNQGNSQSGRRSRRRSGGGGSGGQKRQKSGASRSSGNQSFNSSGPRGNVRGNAKQLFEKYTEYGKDAQSGGHIIDAERFYQYAEHYYRVADEAGLMKVAPKPAATQTDQAAQATQEAPQDNGSMGAQDDSQTGHFYLNGHNRKNQSQSDPDSEEASQKTSEEAADSDAGESKPKRGRRKASTAKAKESTDNSEQPEESDSGAAESFSEETVPGFLSPDAS